LAHPFFEKYARLFTDIIIGDKGCGDFNNKTLFRRYGHHIKSITLVGEYTPIENLPNLEYLDAGNLVTLIKNTPKLKTIKIDPLYFREQKGGMILADCNTDDIDIIFDDTIVANNDEQEAALEFINDTIQYWAFMNEQEGDIDYIDWSIFTFYILTCDCQEKFDDLCSILDQKYYSENRNLLLAGFEFDEENEELLEIWTNQYNNYIHDLLRFAEKSRPTKWVNKIIEHLFDYIIEEEEYDPYYIDDPYF
jgi:hypothetical protein